MTETTPPKEESTPVEPEKTVESKLEVTPVKPEGEVSESKTEEKKKEEEAAKEPEEPKEPEPINEGSLNKRGPGLLKFWRKTYFAFGSEPTPLQDLQVYYKKNAKKLAPTKKPAAGTANATSTPTIPAETEAADTTAEPPKAEEPKVVEEVKESKEAEDKRPETKEAEIKEAEDKKPETKEAEIKEAEDKKPEEAEIKEAEDKKPETKEAEIKEAEDKKPETKESEIKEAEDKKPETKEAEAEETKEDEPSKNVNHIFYNNIAHATQTGEGLLFYYRSKNERKHPIGIINLKEVLDVKELVEHHIGKSFAFRVETSYRVFELAADSKSDRERWIKTINEKVAKIKEANESIETSDGYKDTYDRLIQGTAFHPPKADEVVMDEVFSGDEETDKPRSTEANKRKSIFPGFFGGRKPSTSESTTIVTSETKDDGKVTTTNTEAISEENESGEVPKSPQRSSKFLANFFKKSEKDETTHLDDVKEEKVKATEETSAETSTAAVTPTAETTQHKDKDHKESSGFKLKLFKSRPKDEANKGGDSTEAKSESEPSAEATTPEVKSEEKTESKSEEKTAETPEKSSFLKMFKDLSKPNTEDKSETPEDKVESKSEDKKAEKVEEPKESEKKEEKKEEKKKEKKKEKKEKKEGDDSSDSHSDDASEEDKEPEPSLVRRVTTKFFRRAKSPKAEEKKAESREVTTSEPTEEKKDTVETTDSTEKNDAPTQTAEQTVPESSTEPTDDKTKKKEKGSILLNFGRRISGGVGKRQNSLPSHESTQEKGEKGETGETGETAETAETAAVATATEATDIENADKTTTKSEKEKEPEKPEIAVQKHVFPEGIKKGNLQKQSQILKTFNQRYFVLTPDKKLHYYRSSSDPSTQKTIDLSSDCKVKLVEGTKFDLETKTRTYKLIAESDEERDSWIKELKELGVTSEKEPSKKPEEATKLVEVPKSENTDDIQQSVDNAANKAADAVEASVSEGQKTTTKPSKVETTEVTEETTETTEKTEKTVTTETV